MALTPSFIGASSYKKERFSRLPGRFHARRCTAIARCRAAQRLGCASLCLPRQLRQAASRYGWPLALLHGAAQVA